MRWIVLFMAALGCALLGGCGADNSQGNDTGAADSVATVQAQEDEEEFDYRAFLTGAIVDTLEGDASFGWVVSAGTTQQRLLIRLTVPGDFTGGFFINLGDSTLPAPGEYDLTAREPEDPEVQLNEYGIVYRKGLLLNLASTSGTLTLESVTDTLIQGSFNATLFGETRVPAAAALEGEVNANGEFQARPGRIGFILGL
jgi:hypothetical protein